MENKIKYIHFVGIGGSGMSGIAEIMHNMKFEITGSDTSSTSVTEHLKSRGIKLFTSHDVSNISQADVIVTSSAISKNNCELVAAKKLKIPIIPRAEMLAELMRFKVGIAIAGTHGKTSTTSILASIMNTAGMDPTYVIGGRINSLKQSARLGKSKYMIVEADESDASFLHLNPHNVLLTNIDFDHMETYGYDEQRLKKTFLDFLHQIPFYNAVFVCIDDANIKSILKHIERPIITYGLNKKADFFADQIQIKKNLSSFRVNSSKNKFKPFKVEIAMPGKHYVLNTMGAIAVADHFKINHQVIKQALFDFKGVARRFDFYENFKIGRKNVHLIDDYGHHPTEIQAVIKSIKKGFPRKKINLVFQPHRYSRTQDLIDDFIKVLSKVDRLFLFDIYSAGEKVISKISSKNLLKKITCDSYYLPEMSNSKDFIEKKINSNEILLVMGAGSIGKWFSQNFIENDRE
jgi:UDP-N-acetylmuramate--alanine ligase